MNPRFAHQALDMVPAIAPGPLAEGGWLATKFGAAPLCGWGCHPCIAIAVLHGDATPLYPHLSQTIRRIALSRCHMARERGTWTRPRCWRAGACADTR